MQTPPRTGLDGWSRALPLQTWSHPQGGTPKTTYQPLRIPQISSRRREARTPPRSEPVSKCRSRGPSSGHRDLRGRRTGPGAAGRPLLLLVPRSDPHHAGTRSSARDADTVGPPRRWAPRTRPHSQQNTKPFPARLRMPRPNARPLTSDPGSPISPTA